TLAFGSDAHLMNIAGHALVGCGSAVASGGRCGPGALAGAVGSFAGPLLRGLDSTSKLVATSVLGGLASVAGGGKFANGAVTGAFGYLFNWVGRGSDGRLWAVQPTADEYARRYTGQDGFPLGEPVYRAGSDVNLNDYAS